MKVECRLSPGDFEANHETTILSYIRFSVHLISRLKKSNEMKQYADIYLLLNYSTCFGRPSLPSSGVHETLVAASVPEVATAILFTHDDGRDERPKHVE